MRGIHRLPARQVAGAVMLVVATACSAGAPRASAAGVQPMAGAPVVAAKDGQGGVLAGQAADVRFMQHMIAHHAQALEMTALVAERTSRDDIRLLARRIDVAQEDEIRQMQRWLRQRGHAVHGAHESNASHESSGSHGSHPSHPSHPPAGATGGGHGGMPGMLTAAQMSELEAARGAAFDRLFLEYMIMHHEGALVMVSELFRSPGAAQDAETFELATHIESDQRIEIARMRRMLHDMER